MRSPSSELAPPLNRLIYSQILTRCEGFNILLYGVGSKLNILNSFCKECLSDALYVNIHGFFPSLTLKQVLSSITEEALEYEGKFSSNYEHAEYIKKYFSEGLSFHEWYQECREAFLVTSEVTMQAQLSEFKNHKLLNSRKSIEGCELWYIPVDVVTLEQFLDSSAKWVRAFKDGRENVHDEPRPGQPSVITDDLVNAVDEKIREDRRFTISTLALKFPNVGRTTLHKVVFQKVEISQIVCTLGSQAAY
ncbi:origin recognition complex subunit 2 [Trichonephila clavipes]|nr:origin recognition complex subunit 2 [Trichonephila clavipes]